MSGVQETIQGAIEEARGVFAYEYPIVNFIVGILVAYVVIYFITFYLGPVLFGLHPYRPWPVVGRTMHHVTRRAAELFGGEDAAKLAEKITSAIQPDDRWD